MIIRAIFQSWAREASQNLYQQLKDENARLRQSLGKQADNIWAMRKADLVEMAVRERVVTNREVAEKMRVGQLQQLLKDHRDLTKTPNEKKISLARVKQRELIELAERLGLDPMDPKGRLGLKNREKLIAMIEATKHWEGAVNNNMEEETAYPDNDETSWQEVSMPERGPVSSAPRPAVSNQAPMSPQEQEELINQLDPTLQNELMQFQNHPGFQELLSRYPQLLRG